MVKLFISDLHLEEARPDITALFFKFLHNDTKSAEALYILGDFFEAYIGDDDDSDFMQLISENLKKATDRGLPIFINHGNRDFLLGKRFFAATGCRLIPEEHVINIAGVPTLLMHGDSLCTEDKAYLKFRKKSRNWFFQKLILLKSLKARKKIAANMRAKSKAYTSTAPIHLMDVTPTEVDRVLLKHQVSHLIHGHTHRPQIHHFILNGQPARRTVLGPWHEQGNVLICHDDGRQEMIDFGKEP